MQETVIAIFIAGVSSGKRDDREQQQQVCSGKLVPEEHLERSGDSINEYWFNCHGYRSPNR